MTFIESITLTGIATLVAIFGALITIWKTVREYSIQGAQKRIELFSMMRDKMQQTEGLEEILFLLDTDDPHLAEVSFIKKRRLLGYFEEIALMLNSRLIDPKVAHYMFGYYAIRTWKSKYFWSDVNRESLYWSLFADFAQRMIAEENNKNVDTKRLRF